MASLFENMLYSLEKEKYVASHPYAELPNHTRWNRSVSNTLPQNVDPVVSFPFKITASDKVATAGSCFAQHIARHLKGGGFNYFVAEEGHPIVPLNIREENGYGLYSARYGNIYTSRQLDQLLRRALGEFTPRADYWRSPKVKGYIDPLRPTIQANGFSSIEELRADREHHLQRVRYMLETMDYFVFTLGLTECWHLEEDGTVFPICPGVAGGEFDPSKMKFHNLNISDVLNDMKSVLERLRSINARARVILTVSPVPLAATALDKHVLTATTYSKSVLRVAAEELSANFENVAYFPSYEIITGNFNRGAYFAPDLRSINEEGVEHVMRLFLNHATENRSHRDDAIQSSDLVHDEHLAKMSSVVQVLCDEELLSHVSEDSQKI